MPAAAVFLLSIPNPVYGQDAAALERVSHAVALAAAGDTLGALGELELALDTAPDLAEAHYHLGRLLGRRARSPDADFRDRERAEMALLRAVALQPENPDYVAEYLRFQDSQRLTTDGERVLAEVMDKADTDLSDPLRAEVEYNLGFIAERDYERFRDRHMVAPLTPGISTGLPASDYLSRYVEWYLDNSARIEGSGDNDRRKMLGHYRAALRHDPTHFEAGRRLMLLLLEDGELPEYLTIAQQLAQAHPERPEALLYGGLGLHALAREEEAGAAFDSALAAMPVQVSAPFLDLAPVMKRRSAETYRGLDGAGRGRFEDIYWRFSDPLLLTEANEVRLEHLSRVAYADLRFAEPAAGRRGWETERGVTFIRYGPPHRVARFRGCDMGPSSTTIVWVYHIGRRLELDVNAQVAPAGAWGTSGLADASTPPPRLGSTVVFMFCQMNGYFRARFAGDYKWVADEYRHWQPSNYENIPSIPALFPTPLQIARFRGDSPAEVAVEVHAELPLGPLARGVDLENTEIETGLFLLNQLGERIVEQVDTQAVSYADAADRNPLRSWRLILPAAGKLVAAVEARDAGTWRAAAARDTFAAQLFPDDSLAVSDILLADALRPLADKPRRRTDYDIMANPTMEYAPNQPVVIYYELYGLDQDNEGFSSYEASLSVTVKSLDRGGTLFGGDRNPLAILGLLADAWGFSAVGDDRLELRFSRQLDMKGRDRATEYHSLDLRTAPAGEYEITLQVWDALADRLATRTRRFTVIRDD